MSAPYSPEQIRRLAELLAREVMGASGAAPPAIPSAATAAVQTGDGVFSTLDEAVGAARVAFRALDALGLEKRFEVIASMRDAMRQSARHLAEAGVGETGLGRVEDKVKKNLLVTNKTPGPEEL